VDADPGDATGDVESHADAETGRPELTGTYAGRAGEIPIEGTIKDKAISFSAKISAQGQEIVLTFAGTVDQDTMKGTVDFGGMGSANWTGARKK
jgi:hypothetical protein